MSEIKVTQTPPYIFFLEFPLRWTCCLTPSSVLSINDMCFVLINISCLSHVSFSLPQCPPNLSILPSSSLCLSSHSLSMSGANIPSMSFALFIFSPSFSSPLLNPSVGDSEECGEERCEHVRSPEIPLRSGEQWGVFLLTPCGVESHPQWPVAISHLPCWPGHPGLSWSGAKQSW